jgi:hypothetical protein
MTMNLDRAGTKATAAGFGARKAQIRSHRPREAAGWPQVLSGLKTTRIVLVGLPRVLSGIVTDLVSPEPGLAIVGEVEDADVAIAQLEPGAAEALLEVRPRLRVVAISADGREASTFELRRYEEWLGEVSPKVLLAAIRGERSG